MSPEDKRTIKETLEILYAIELLAYHDKSWLCALSYNSPKTYNENKRQLIKRALRVLK